MLVTFIFIIKCVELSYTSPAASVRDVFQVLRDTQRLSGSCLKLFGFLFVTKETGLLSSHPKKLSFT